ncbi:hypothetical protein B0H67DRAFT_549886 [Lasiosphaeris hirsuta]|uniref:Uncharacterized protein n=1 Tax=Lasiosphaeris hirsuta TaxID=260670 RepID=A0AA40BE96_9PEZI|nr:hypothetical protein B0H67DRAFT_549886 [Lasiosphaeris hirsuta]
MPLGRRPKDDSLGASLSLLSLLLASLPAVHSQTFEVGLYPQPGCSSCNGCRSCDGIEYGCCGNHNVLWNSTTTFAPDWVSPGTLVITFARSGQGGYSCQVALQRGAGKRECFEPNKLTYVDGGHLYSIWTDGTEHTEAIEAHGYHSPQMKRYVVENHDLKKRQADSDGTTHARADSCPHLGAVDRPE